MVGETLKLEERSIRLDFMGLEFNPMQGNANLKLSWPAKGPKVKSSELTDIELKDVAPSSVKKPAPPAGCCIVV